MNLNTLSPALGSKPSAKRVGRGIGSGVGKTCGRGHKGQKARSGGFHKLGFEGGQMPIQKRLPKFGFTSLKSLYVAEIRLHELNNIISDVIDLDILKQNGLIRKDMKFARIVSSGKLNKSFIFRGVHCTKGAVIAIESAGGKIE